MADIEQGEDEVATLLRKQGWYFGELSEEAGTAILKTCGEYNVFIVYLSPTQNYVLSARFPVDELEDGLIEHLTIHQTDNGDYQLTGQTEVYPTIIEAVDTYTSSREPPLYPALGKRQLEAQLSISSMTAPPDYTEANRQLQPDIGTLPKIDNIALENAVEAKTGRISPTGSLRQIRQDSYMGDHFGRSPTPLYMNNSHWWRYRNKPCCHPKNVCHCCCYRETYWTGYREAYEHKWYNCQGTGFCRCLLLVLMWLLIWPCVGIGFCIAGCFLLCFFCCCYEDDD